MKKPYLVILFCSLLLAIVSVYTLNNGSLGIVSIFPSSVSRSSSGMNSGVMQIGDTTSEKIMIAPDYPMPSIGGGTDAMMVTDRAVSYNSYHSVIVSDVTEYTKNLRAFITSVNGQVLSSSQGKSDSYDYASLYAKVPVANFDQTTQKVVENTKKIVNESINTADMTGQVENTDVQIENVRSQITIKEAELTEARVQSEKTRIQAEITRLQRQLDSLQKQGENIQEQVEYATVQVTVSNKESYFDPHADLGIIETIKEAVRSLRGSFKFIVVIAIWAVVYSVILIPAYLIVRWLRGKLSNKVV